jgi:hypothetical protein
MAGLSHEAVARAKRVAARRRATLNGAAEGCMSEQGWTIRVADTDGAAASGAAGGLADRLREIAGVESAERGRERDDTMDLGTIVTVVATSAAATAVAQGIAAWLKARRGTKLRVTRPDGTVVELNGVDPDAGLKALRASLQR